MISLTVEELRGLLKMTSGISLLHWDGDSDPSTWFRIRAEKDWSAPDTIVFVQENRMGFVREARLTMEDIFGQIERTRKVLDALEKERPPSLLPEILEAFQTAILYPDRVKALIATIDKARGRKVVR